MKKNMKDNLIEIFDRLIDHAPAVLSILPEGKNAKDLYISAPAIIIKYFMEAIESKSTVSQRKKQPSYRNIKLIPSTDWALTFFHMDYILLNEKWMIHKIYLTPPQNKLKCGEEDFRYEAFFIRVRNLLQDSLNEMKLGKQQTISNIPLSEEQLKELKNILACDNSDLANEPQFFDESGLNPKKFIDKRIALCNVFGLDFWDALGMFCHPYDIERLKALHKGQTIKEFEKLNKRPNEDETLQQILNNEN
jgi:hypothetical protein